MTQEKYYLKVVPPFTLDKRLDPTSKETPAGKFVILKNFIPDRDVLRTREGITLFTHTAAV